MLANKKPVARAATLTIFIAPDLAFALALVHRIPLALVAVANGTVNVTPNHRIAP